MKENIRNLLNEQINKELYSAYLYLDFSSYFKRKGLNGYANWYYVQAQEERDHAMMIYEYLHQSDESVVFEAIAKPSYKADDMHDILKEALKHEKYVSDSIHTIYAAAEKAEDYRTLRFLDFFVKEQVEEEANALDILNQYDLFGANPSSLYMLNAELAKRVYNSPAQAEQL